MGILENIADFLSKEAGQRRTQALNEGLAYYVPPELRQKLGLLAEMTPTATAQRAGQAGERMMAPDRTAAQRVGDLGAMLSETAGVVAPAVVANRVAMPVAQAVQEGLLGFSMGADDIGRRFVERMNQPGSIQTRRPQPAPIGDTAAAVYMLGDRLSLPSGYVGPSGRPNVVRIPDAGEFEARAINPIEQAAREYMERRGMDTTPLSSYPKQDPERGRLIGAAYEAMKDDPYNPAVRRAYDAMVQETLDQYNALKNSGIEFKFLREGMSDPYARSPAMGYQDLVENGRLWVFPTDFGYGAQSGSALFDASANPLLQRVGRIGDKADAVANDAFRAVHDTYGHFGPGNPFFRAPGEERAWIEHSRMYSPEARGAMTSETRGQNSWLNFGPYAEHNKTALGGDTRFADQKIGLMDDWVTELYGMPDEEQKAILAQIMQGWK